jgi:cytochrome c
MRTIKPTPTKAALVLVTILGSSSGALAASDPVAGQRVFATHCAVCHTTQAGQNKIGPSLAGIVGSKSGTVPGFDFSPALKNANITWDDANLDKFLANPVGFVHGTKMFVNLPNATDRQNVIAYLETLKK